jgi:signal peptidase I
LFSYDGKNTKNIISNHYITDLLADNNLVLVKDISEYPDEPLSEVMKLRIYSQNDDNIITIDNRTQISDPMGFGESKVAVLADGISLHSPISGDRLPSEGIAVFDLKSAFSDGTVKQIKTPYARDISSDEKVDVNQDCFSDRYFVWMKGVKTVNGGEDQYQCKLYATDLNTLENTVLATEDDISFWLYSYAVDGDYSVYKNDGKIFLHYIPNGERKEIIISGNNEFEVGDIVEFDEGQLLVRAYPKEYESYEPTEYEIWFIDLNSYINPVKETGTETIAQDDKNNAGKTKTPVLLILPIFAILTVFIIFIRSFGKK